MFMSHNRHTHEHAPVHTYVAWGEGRKKGKKGRRGRKRGGVPLPSPPLLPIDVERLPLPSPRSFSPLRALEERKKGGREKGKGNQGGGGSQEERGFEKAGSVWVVVQY